ncbi:MAG TPA: TOBE domain-containing protein, partial [Candidatus Methylomirabilis sp.]|nr:TOBE domain-containing protein [Candidatus Methylomirabilis sp.]
PESSSPTAMATLAAEVGRVEFLGASTRYEVAVGKDVTLLVAAFDEWPGQQFHPGDRVWAVYDPARVTLLEEEARPVANRETA